MKKVLIFDTECYPDYWLIAFRNVESGKVTSFEIYDGVQLDKDRLRKILKSYRIVGFNSINYDIPMIFLALHKPDTEFLKRANDLIINGKMRWWDIERKYGFKIPTELDHIDLIEVAPGKASLKMYGGKMHVPTLRELPYQPQENVVPDRRQNVLNYCVNDLTITQTLYETLLPQIELREKMSIEYGQDLRSKSDAQIAEAVINAQISKLTGRKPERPNIEQGTVFRYRKPFFISFKTEVMHEIMTRLVNCEYIVDHTGKVRMSEALDKEVIPFGASKYRIGIGGLHSCEESVTHVEDDEWVIVDRDVASYYPSIIINCSLFPKQMGRDFLAVYGKIIKDRLLAKASGDKTTADSLKITTNGSFGKFGSKWSTLYSPDLLLQTTITGQLSLLMLIELLETNGARVVSANTDGVVFKCRRGNKAAIDDLIWAWENLTGFTTEETNYRMLCSRDINNFIAVKTNGSVKLKGAYAPPAIVANSWPNPHAQVCVDAVIAYLREALPLEDTIHRCSDIKQFVSVRTVKGGAIKDDTYLGKAIRWYYKEGETGAINYKVNNYKVPKTEGASPLMTLPSEMPDDIDYAWYIREAGSILENIGSGILA